MRGAGGLVAQKRAGIMASRIPTPAWLHFCPVCIGEDKRLVGEAYWHRLHQLTGVLVCPDHNVFLEESLARRDSARDFLRFVPAEDVAGILPVRPLNLSNNSHQILLKLAQDASWLLNHHDLDSDLTAIYTRYLGLLINRGLATYTGSIHVKQMLEEFRKYYPTSILKLLRCEFTGADQIKTNWLLRLVRPPKHAQHPLYHLLLMQFLGRTAEEFFCLPTELNFFGEGPWPCLNPAAEHFQEPLILGFKLSSRLRDGRPTAMFSCCCGFIYARSGPDTQPEDKFRIGRMISFGPVWEAKLKQAWKASSLSLSEVGRRLGVDPLTVRRHAVRLRLPTLRSDRESKPLNPAARLKIIHDAMVPTVKRRTYRSKWISSMRQSPQITLRTLRRRHAREYAWLLQNDSEWLKRNSPHSRRGAWSTSGVDWKKRDAKTAAAVQAAATRLKDTHARPVQVTRTAIGRAIGAVALLGQKLHKMPLTAQTLAKVVETRVEYAVRRIWWAAECFIRDYNQPLPWQLFLRANVYSLRSVPEVKSAVDAAVGWVESNLSLKQKLKA